MSMINENPDEHEIEISLTLEADQPKEGQAVVESAGESMGGDE